VRCWNSSTRFTGFSHGAAGAGLALLELAAVTGESSFADVGRRAFAYERGVYDPTSKNWPDFRQSARQQVASQPSCATFWCHGAPGIALSRLRAGELLPDDVARNEAITALDTTRSWVASAIASGQVNYSLCHGVTGNAEVLLEGRDLLGPGAVELMLEAADAGIESYSTTGKPWPCGTHEGSTANLLLGLAGIGYFYLRLASPAIPSVLLVRAERL
jgi:lantibiotic modifying enzyme